MPAGVDKAFPRHLPAKNSSTGHEFASTEHKKTHKFSLFRDFCPNDKNLLSTLTQNR
jgi:hypothetical protein